MKKENRDLDSGVFVEEDSGKEPEKKKKRKGGSFFYCLGQGFKGIGRNKFFFIASVITIALCVLLIGLFLAVVLNVNYMVDQVEETVCVSVFFDEGTSEDEILDLASEVETWEEVSYTEYISADEAWENYKEEYFADYPELAEGFGDDNPLANSASVNVYLYDVEQQDAIVEEIEGLDNVRQVNASEETAEALTEIGKVVGIVSLVLIIILLAVSIFLITNTIITGITVRKEEIKIMKYVGATDFFVKAPFVFEGIIIGLIGAVIPLIIIFFVYRGLASFMMEQIFAGSFAIMPIGTVFAILIPISLVIGAGIGFVGSLIAVGRHIKV